MAHQGLKSFGSSCCSVAQLCPTLCDPRAAALPTSLSFTISWSLLKLMFIESVMLSNHLIVCHPLLLLPSIFPSIRVFSNESALCIRWPKYWSFSFSFNISPSNEHPGLISLQSKGLSRVFPQHHSSKASIPYHSAVFIIKQKGSCSGVSDSL